MSDSFLKRGLTPRPGYQFWRADWWFGQVDSRPISAFRIVLALLLLKDALYDLTLTRDFLSDSGIVPRSVFTNGLGRSARFSLMDALPYPWMATAFILLWIAVLLMLLVGYRTRLMSILNVVMILSIHERNLFILNGADTVFRVLSIWCIFLPLGQYYSVDALRARLARYRLSRALADLRPTDSPRTGWAFPLRIAQFQIAIIYVFTGVFKIIQPGAWRTGLALYYAFQLKSLTLPTGDWLGANAPLWMLGVMNYQTLFTELGFALFVFSPFFQPFLRKAGLALGAILHFGIAVTMAISNFSMAMWASYLLFFEPGWIEWLDARLRRLQPGEQPSRVGIPARANPLWLLIAATRADQIALAWDVPPPLPGCDAWTITDQTGGHLSGREAWRRAAGSLPFSRLWSWLLRPALVRRALWAGLGTISAHALTPPPDAEAEPEPAAIAQSGLMRGARIAAKGFLAAGLGTMFGLVIWWNLSGIQISNKHIFPGVPHPVSDIVLYPGLWQAWDMFSPYPQTFDGWIVIPGTFEDGKIFDLRTGLPVSDQQPRTYVGTADRWKKFEDNLVTNRYQQILDSWSSMYCQTYNVEQNLPQGRRLASLEIIYKIIYSHAPGKPSNPVRDVMLWRHWCYGQYR
jgi:hypothetical protein